MWTMNKKFQAIIVAVTMLLASATTTAQDEHPAQEIVQGSITDMLTYLADNIDAVKADPSIIMAKADELIVPQIDFVTMTRLSVGKNWNTADETQQKDLVTQFKTLLLKTYTSAMTQYSGEVIEFEPFRPESRDDRAIVRSAFKQSGSSDVPVIYKLREKEGWQIYDIEVAGLSLVGNFRQKFTDEINSKGIDGLLAFLKERTSR